MKKENYIIKNNHVYFIDSCFSQWYQSPFSWGGNNYKNAEMWMMAQKARTFFDNQSLYKILMSSTPKEAKELGRQIKDFKPEIWDAVKFNVVVAGNMLKFGQNPELLNLLLMCSKQGNFVECNEHDSIWGIGLSIHDERIYDSSNWNGQNLLGKALDKVVLNWRELLND